jgi:DNA polymerase III alpha subunit (gram-positive type)
MIIFFDTETSGLPKDYNAHVHDLDNWPRMVQLAWQHYDDKGNKIAEHCYIIYPDGYEIPKEVSDLNRVTTERAKEVGLPLTYVLDVFAKSLEMCDLLVAHNYTFDKSIIGSELIRQGMENIYENKIKTVETLCTMKKTTNYCQIPGIRGYKWPKLQELHTKLFGAEFEEAHDALVDVRAMAKCYYELKKLNII